MSIAATNNLTAPLFISPDMTLAKEIGLEANQKFSSVTLSSLDTPVEKVKEIYENAVKQAEDQINAVSASLDLKKLRELRKKEKLASKQDRISKSKNREEIDVVIPEVKKISGADILKLRFSQDSIKSETMEGMKLPDLIQNMKDKGWKKGTTITVIRMPDNTLVSLDNRRLYAAKQVASEKDNFTIQIQQFNHFDSAPKKMLDGVIKEYTRERQASTIHMVPEEISPNTYGHLAKLRIHARNGELNSPNFGYEADPIIRV